MRKCVLWMVIVLLMLPVSGLAEGDSLTAGQKEADIDVLCDTLEAGHFNLHALVDEVAWAGRVQALRTKADGMDDMTFSLALMELVASIGDSHTRAGLNGNTKERLGALPFQLMWFGDGLYLLAATKEYEPYLGQKLTSLGGLSVPELMERFRGFISHDNETWYRRQFAQFLIGAEYLVYLGIIESPDEVAVTFEDEDGVASEVMVKAEYGELYNLEFAMLQRERIPLAQQGESLYYSTELDGDALMISYHSCQEDPNLPMADFAEQVQGMIEKNGYGKVLVDLRYNGGGNSSILEPMIDMLGALRRDLGFELYAMIGENTFSSALMNAVQIQKRAGAILVGQPTGGSVNHYGEIRNVQLPNAEVMVTYSTKFFNMLPGQGIDSLKPDVAVETTLADFVQGHDPEIAYILAAE